MLEAVSSALQTAPSVRGHAEQASTLESFAANPGRVQKVLQAPYISPYVRVDVNFDKAVLELRDSDTGDVVTQIPSMPRLEAIRREVARQQAAEAAPPVHQSQSAQAFVQQTSPEPAHTDAPPPQTGVGSASAAVTQQIAAFHTAANAGAGSGGNISIFA